MRSKLSSSGIHEVQKSDITIPKKSIDDDRRLSETLLQLEDGSTKPAFYGKFELFCVYLWL